MDEEVDLWPILEQLATLPPLDFAYSEETEERLPGLVGGLSVALARTFKVLDPKLKTRTPPTGAGLPDLRFAVVGPRHGSTEAQEEICLRQAVLLEQDLQCHLPLGPGEDPRVHHPPPRRRC